MGYFKNLAAESPDLLHYRNPRDEARDARQPDDTDNDNQRGNHRVKFYDGWDDKVGHVLYFATSGEAYRKNHYLVSLGFRVYRQYWNSRERCWS
jgi:hypothetical protein